MWSGVMLLGIGIVCVVSYQIGKMKGWDEWDEQYEQKMDDIVSIICLQSGMKKA
ncbi:hypothetical protein F4694_004395 [Bacillus niacini]|uniref:Uncharacterized protein n=1 Tax=Neobacillus niacini TaxID=86668 RepID=A0A852TKG9_9BACI|nr:hypothetical protein [Neobacillus niacini]NYE07584.1 hypothetical protein [Neobacillus niacini]